MFRSLRHLLLPALLAAPLSPFGGCDASAQTVEDRIRALALENAERYVTPVSRGLGYALTAGAFDRPAVLGAFHVDAGIRLGAAFPNPDDRTFEAVLPASITWEHPTLGSRSYQDPYRARDGTLTTPTAMGRGAGVVLEPAGDFRADLVSAGRNPSDYDIPFPPGLDFSLIPAAILHLSVGVGLGSEVTVRYLPEMSVAPDVGRFSGRGLGVKHELSRWFTSPVDLAVGIARQELSVDGYVDATALEGWLLAGRQVGPLTFFGTAGVRRASVELRYEVTNPDGVPGLPADGTAVVFRSDLDAGTSAGAGVRLQLLLLNLGAQVTMAEQSTLSLKVALAFP
jgi:hypothetical protein